MEKGSTIIDVMSEELLQAAGDGFEFDRIRDGIQSAMVFYRDTLRELGVEKVHGGEGRDFFHDLRELNQPVDIDNAFSVIGSHTERSSSSAVSDVIDQYPSITTHNTAEAIAIAIRNNMGPVFRNFITAELQTSLVDEGCAAIVEVNCTHPDYDEVVDKKPYIQPYSLGFTYVDYTQKGLPANPKNIHNPLNEYKFDRDISAHSARVRIVPIYPLEADHLKFTSELSSSAVPHDSLEALQYLQSHGSTDGMSAELKESLVVPGVAVSGEYNMIRFLGFVINTSSLNPEDYPDRHEVFRARYFSSDVSG